jgi:hypothetical protein
VVAALPHVLYTDVVGLATRGGSTQWQMLHGLLENTIYGGRVDNKFDAQVRVVR